MKKRLLAGLLAAAMLTGLGSVVFAEGENDTSEGTDAGINPTAADGTDANTTTEAKKGTISILTKGGTMTTEGNVTTVTFSSGTELLSWADYQAATATSNVRDPSWYAGVKVVAPDEATDATYLRDLATLAQKDSKSKSFLGAKDGEENGKPYVGFWVTAQPCYFDEANDSIKTIRRNADGNLEFIYEFTWTKGASEPDEILKVIVESNVTYNMDGVEVAVYDENGDMYAGFQELDKAVAAYGTSAKHTIKVLNKIEADTVLVSGPESLEVKPGGEIAFTAKAAKKQGENAYECVNATLDNVTWSVEGAEGVTVADGTEVTDGTLTVAAEQAPGKLTVKAVSGTLTAGTIEVTVTEKAPSIPSYELTIATEDATEVTTGTAATVRYTPTLKKTVDGTTADVTDATIDWAVARKDNAAVATGTKIENGVLTVAAAEPAGELTVTATYTPAEEGAAPAAATATITVKAAEEKPGEDDPKPDTTVATVDVAVAPASVAQGGTATVTVTAKNAAGETLTKDVAYKTASGKGTFNGNVLTVAEDETVGKLEIIVTIDGKEYKGSLDVTAKSSGTTTPGGNGGSSSGSGSSGGSSSGSGSTSAAPKTETTTVTETSAATQTTKAVEQAIAKAEKADAATATATVKVQNAKSISAKALESMVKAAEKAAEKKDTEVNLVLHADVVKNGKVESRLYIDPTKATLKSDLKLGVTLGDQKVEKKFDKYFENKIAVVKFDQVGTFGMNIKAAVKADLKGMNTRNLHFYSYDAKTNTYVKLANPKYWVDANGYLHFTTSQGNYVVVTDAPLVRK